MKFMGSKSQMLRGALGRMLIREVGSSDRFVDLFCGSGSVSRFVAERHRLPVLSSDLQYFATVLCGAVTERSEPYINQDVTVEWCKRGVEDCASDLVAKEVLAEGEFSRRYVLDARRKAEEFGHSGFVMRDYGGHYFSPLQARQFDLLHQSLPEGGIDRKVALAALIRAASRCAAAPGHTAQPFQPSERLLPHIANAWSRSVATETQRALDEIARQHALVEGRTLNAAATEVISDLQRGDFVFCDPPYSDVQYSRFYHVLEGISRGGWPAVTGAGRAPEIALRSTSDFSLRSRSAEAMRDLLQGIRDRDCARVAITFPNTEASNGLSARSIAKVAKQTGWRVNKTLVDATHSTLGGSGEGGARDSRRAVREALFLLDRN